MLKMLKKISLIVSVLLSCSLASAQSQRENIYQLNDFSGGLVNKVSEFSINKNQSTRIENARLNSSYKSLAKRSNLNTYGSADSIEPITGIFRHYEKDGDKMLVVSHGDEIESGNDNTGVFTSILDLTTTNKRWQFVTWHDILIGTDGYNKPIKYDGSSASATYLGSLLATVTDSGSGPDTGLHSYKVSCYTTSYEVILNQASNIITGDGNDATLTMIPICPDYCLGEATTGRKIYRTEAGGATYKLLSNGTIADNTTVTLTDSDADAALGDSYPAGDETWTPPTGRFIIVQNNRLFLANDPTNSPSRICFSDDGSHDIFNVTSYLDVRQNDGDSITFLKGNLGVLTVGKNNTIQRVNIDGTDPDVDWSISDPISYVGCQAPYSAENSPFGIIYLGRDGIYRFNGYKSELLSETITPTIFDISSTDAVRAWGIYHDNFYYLAYTSAESGEAQNNRVIVLDLLAKAYSIDLLNINTFTVFNSGTDNGVLYAGSSTDGSVYGYSNDENEVVHKRRSDFAGLWDDMRYIPEGRAGGDADSPILEIARTETIDEFSGTIDDAIGIIDRQDTLGHYVSQVLNIGAMEFDELSWNGYTPGASTITFQIRTSATGEQNLLLNDDFEFWDNYVTGTPSTVQPNDWAYTQDGAGGSVADETSEVQLGDHSAKITKSDSGDSEMTFIVPNPSNYQGLPLTFSAYIKSANTVGEQVLLEIDDGTTYATSAYANGAGWEHISNTHTVSATASSIEVRCKVLPGADAVAYFDHAMLTQSSSNTNDWTAWSDEFSDPSGSDISEITANTYLQYLINLETDVITTSPTIVKLDGYNVKITYSKGGTPASTGIPLIYETGWLDLGDSVRPKILRGLETYHEGTENSFTITVENFEGDTDTFEVNLTTNPKRYKEYFAGGAMRGRFFKIKVENTSGVLPFTLHNIILNYDLEPLTGADII